MMTMTLMHVISFRLQSTAAVERCVLAIAIVFLTAGAKGLAMDATILKRTHLPSLPSASAIEVRAGELVVIGDDSPWLFTLHSNGEIARKALLLPGEKDTFRIPKDRKPDLEAMAVLSHRGAAFLCIFGSGSLAPQREVALLVAETGSGPTVQSRSLTSLYAAFRQDRVFEGQVPNIEAAALTANDLVLFQRGNKGRQNAIVRLSLAEMSDFLFDPGKAVPRFVAQAVDLPKIQDVSAGFSGAFALDAQRIAFSASVEATKDAYNDGKILGSFVGIVEERVSGTLNPVAARLLEASGKPSKSKLEGITLKSKTERELLLWGVVDNDNGSSELLEIRVRLDK